MCEINLEPCDVWRETPRKARKAHSCDSCGGAISPGEIYTVHFSVYDGEAVSDKLCALCKDARAEFADEHGGMLPMPHYFPEMLGECVAEGDEGSKKWAVMLEAIQKRAAVAARA